MDHNLLLTKLVNDGKNLFYFCKTKKQIIVWDKYIHLVPSSGARLLLYLLWAFLVKRSTDF